VTNHRIASRRYEARYAFRDIDGRLAATAHIERTSRYMQQGFEEQILELLVKKTGVPPGRVRTAGESADVHESVPAYPRFCAEDPASFETERPSAVA
jgi:hypothetical protein